MSPQLSQTEAIFNIFKLQRWYSLCTAFSFTSDAMEGDIRALACVRTNSVWNSLFRAWQKRHLFHTLLFLPDGKRLSVCERVLHRPGDRPSPGATYQLMPPENKVLFFFLHLGTHSIFSHSLAGEVINLPPWQNCPSTRNPRFESLCTMWAAAGNRLRKRFWPLSVARFIALPSKYAHLLYIFLKNC